MKVSTMITIILKAILVPIVAIFFLNKFNLFEHITFVPEEYQYEIGLTAYLALIEALYGFGENFINSKKASVVCVFFKSETDKDEKNIPSIICDEAVGVANINCNIELTGNLGRVRKCKLQMELPSWLTAQVSNSDTVLSYTGNLLIWEFDKLLPETGISNQSATYKSKISLIKNTSGNNISIKLEPQMKRIIGIDFIINLAFYLTFPFY